MKRLMLLMACALILSACSNKSVKKTNPLLSLWLPFASSRVKQVYNHSLIKSHRWQSDCKYNCPDMDIWQYQYQDPKSKKILKSDRPISIKKQYWKVSHEARIIAISLFGKEFYYNALLQYLDSFANIKKANNIADTLWGYETFTVRVYVPKRNPKDLEKLSELKGGFSDDMINRLLERGCEIAFVDNKLKETHKDASFWRFAAASDQMPKGQRVRYLMRDADTILVAAEMYAVADWIKSDKRFHRMHIIPICLGPLTAGLWGGVHEGMGDFSDFSELVKNYPYRFEYGDDELFGRDLLWPRIKSIGSVLTHRFEKNRFIAAAATPYQNSCEEPTEKFCKQLNSHSDCEDRLLPESKNLKGAVEALGMRVGLDELMKDHPEYFDLDLKNPNHQFIYEAFKSY